MPRGRNIKGRLLIALAVAGFAVFSYYSNGDFNKITGKKQYVAMSPNQEVAIGLQAAPELASQYGGLAANANNVNLVKQVGSYIVANSSAKNSGWIFEFHLLADTETINAFALPGGQVFITYGLFNKLTNKDQLAGVLAHEIGHVIARHGAQRLAKQNLTQGLVMATGVAAGDNNSAQIAAMVGQVINMKYGRSDEIESDVLGVRFMHEAGYDPNALIDVMHILAESGGGARQPEFFSSHPNPENRIENIKEAIQHYKNIN